MTVFSSQDAFTNLIRSYEYHREQLLILSRQIRQRVREYDNELYSLLKSISGIGPLTASALITELGDINRFSHIDDLSSFVGLIPRVRENGETIHTGGITFRCNSFLRTMLIEASWQAIRQGSSSYAILRLHIKAFTPLSIKNDM